jgi:hypothetical protein
MTADSRQLEPESTNTMEQVKPITEKSDRRYHNPKNSMTKHHQLATPYTSTYAPATMVVVRVAVVVA